METILHYGAFSADWNNWTGLGFTEDLLPVVSNPNAIISERSKMRDKGKTPSRYNHARKVGGIPKWSSYHATIADIKQWSSEPDYGICVQTRCVRALDIDVADYIKADRLHKWLDTMVGKCLPCRWRSNSGKFLLVFRLDGMMPKRIMNVEGGIIEFLGNGQQFVAHGTHSSGVRYEWNVYDNDEIPKLSLSEFDNIWAGLAQEFATAPISEGSIRKDGPTIEVEDPLLNRLNIIGWGNQNQAFIECPFKDEHTSDSGETETCYFPKGTRGYAQGHFKCMHAHCDKRTDGDFISALGLVADMFDDLTKAKEIQTSPAPFTVIDADEFANRPEPEWIIDGVLPQKGAVMITGASGAGKSFLVLDMMASIALGRMWRERPVKQGRVVYVAAEGAAGISKRLRAYKEYHNLSFNGCLGIIDDSPNLLLKDDIALAEAINSSGGAAVIVIDTLAQTTPGANENASEDMGKALAACKKISKATGALIIIIHHLGKDETKGARGWSGMKAAMDTEIEVKRNKDERFGTVTKQKDGEDGIAFPFKLISVNVGEDKTGKEITSCIVEHVEFNPASDNAKPQGKWQKAVYEAVAGLSFDTDPIPVTTIIDEAIKSEAYDAGHDTTKPVRDRRRESARRAIGELSKSGLLILDNNKVCLPQIHNGPLV